MGCFADCRVGGTSPRRLHRALTRHRAVVLDPHLSASRRAVVAAVVLLRRYPAVARVVRSAAAVGELARRSVARMVVPRTDRQRGCLGYWKASGHPKWRGPSDQCLEWERLPPQRLKRHLCSLLLLPKPPAAPPRAFILLRFAGLIGARLAGLEPATF